MAPQPTYTSSKLKYDTSAPKRITRSHKKGKGKLEEIMQAIDIEETPMVKPIEIKGTKMKKKGLTAKKA